MLRWRFTSAAIILGTVIGACWLDYWHHGGRPGIWLAPLCLLVTVLATAEVVGMLRTQRLRPASWAVYAGTVMVMLAACAPLLWKQYPADCPLGKSGWPLVAMALAVVLALIAEMRRFTARGGSIVRAALSIFAIAYVGLLLSFTAQLRFYGDNETGMAALVSMIVVAKLSDIGAYTFGRLFGRNKLVPRLSPGKTIEGTAGGIATACAGSYLMFQFVVPALVGREPITPWWGWLSFGIIVGIAATVGDLAESLLKRDMDRKDSSAWLPGLGGVLDFMDSLLVAAPVAYLCWVAQLVQA